MTDTEKAALERRIDELCAEVERLHADQAHWELGNCPNCPNIADLQESLEQNGKLRELVRDMWQLIIDLDATPYVTERHGNNPAVTWLDDDWSVHESCRERMRELGIEVPA